MKKIAVITAVALLCGAMVSPARAYTHPSIPFSSDDLAFLKASLNQQPWAEGYAILAADSKSQLTYVMNGPFAQVGRNPDVNRSAWDNDMNAVYNLARMWYFTGNSAYAQKAHDILLAWVNTQTSFTGQEIDLELGDYAIAYAGGADILRGTWPGWTAADTTAVQNYFRNLVWPASLAGSNVTGPANKGALYSESGIAVAVFLDDTAKFNHVIDNFRTLPASGLVNTLPTGEMGETGRDQGHAYGTLLGLAFTAEVAWKQGVDLYSELDNRLLACGEYEASNTLVTTNPFVPFGTVDATYYTDQNPAYTANRGALYLIQNAYRNRLHLATPWIDRKLQQQNVDGGNFMYARTADYSTATPMTPIVRPAVSVASSGLTLTTLGSNSAGRSSSYANGIWTVTGLGTNVWNDTGAADDCQFVYQAMTGDCAIIARLTSAQFPATQAKAGVMIRDNLSATVSQRAWVGIRPESGNIRLESYQAGWTDNWGGSNRQTRSDILPPGMPYWIKIERRGTMLNTYSSQDGTSWAAITSSYYSNLPSTVYIGLFVNSGSATTTSTATFDNVAFTGGSGGLVTIPPAPAAVFAVGSGKSITVRWLPSYGATSYNVLRSTTSGGGYAAIASGLSAATTSYVDATAAAGTTYYYVVQAANSAGASGNSPQFGDSRLPAAMVNIAFSGTATANIQNSSTETPDKAFDGDPGSKWLGWSPTGSLQYDFGANNAQVIKRYTISSADVATRDPKNWNLLGSQDGSNWTTLDSQSNQVFANRMQQNTYNLSNTTAYRYYQLQITANNGDGGVAVAELGLWSDSGRTIPDGRYHIVNRKSNKMTGNAGGATANGTLVDQWHWLTGNDGQKWDVTSQGNGQYRLTNVASGRVMEVAGASTANGASVDIWDWLNGNNQKWIITPADDGYFKLTAVHSGKVADVSGGSTADGAKVIQWPYSGADNQQWMPSLSQ